MRTLIWSQAKDTIKRVLGGCSDATALLYANEAQERYLNRADDPVGSWQRMRVCVGACNTLVWPRQVRHIKAWWLCNQPGQFFSEWWEAIGYWGGGWGLTTDDLHAGTTMIDAGTRCSFDNIYSSTTATRKIQAVCSDASDVGKTITLRYIDSNGNRVYTSIGGVVQEGEQLSLSLAGTLTSSYVYTAGLYHVIKATTNYPVRLYEYDPATASQTRLLAVYEPSETVPIYRASTIPSLSEFSACSTDSDTDTDCDNNKTVTLAVRLQHIPVVVDNDPFIIGNLPALKDIVKAIKMAEQHETQLAEYYFSSAERELQGEAAAYLGDGMRITTRLPDVDVWGGAVFNPV